jgi:cytochrome c-type biogenesis protein CcmH/NrfG
MELLATYTFGQALLTVLEFALLILWIWLAVTVVIDVFRSQDLSGWAKAGWIVLIVLLPLLGVLVYVIARGDKMKAHEVSGERLQERSYIADVEDLRNRGILTDDQVQRAKSKSQPITGATPSPDDDVAELEVLRDRGILSDEEFKRAKQKALAA